MTLKEEEAYRRGFSDGCAVGVSLVSVLVSFLALIAVLVALFW